MYNNINISPIVTKCPASASHRMMYEVYSTEKAIAISCIFYQRAGVFNVNVINRRL